jgi:ATP-dependent Lhr-like helicase
VRPGQALTALQPRISWDRIHQRLLALPGSQHLALVSGGTIPDTGQYTVYTTSGARIGELDEEFIYERRIGDTFLLGTTPWRLDQIEADRVIVLPAEGSPALVPFWHGEQAGRSLELGRAIGAFLAELAGRLEQPDCQEWLQQQYFLDSTSAQNVREFVRRQRDRAGLVPTDQRVVVEASRDQLGDWQVLLLSPLGHRVHLGLRLALENRLRERLGYSPQILHHDDGLLIRLTDSPEPVMNIFEGITAENVRARIIEELADSALFALRFRHNAARALLLPRLAGGKRAPLW